MESYLIGGGAVLATGAQASITRATMHAQLRHVGDEVRGALIDFESGSLEDVRRLVALGSAITAEHFEAAVTPKLLATGVCGLADVAAILAAALQISCVHLFARWAPDDKTVDALRTSGVELRMHPLEAIVAAALVTEYRFTVWSGTRAA
ncbi:MAG: hypothetical protein M3126_00885 [Candidatus Eremiobacteraeota bacterium]|nr:hypothetical protein [Candidatus Eremiobacteraeota bacterium]